MSTVPELPATLLREARTIAVPGMKGGDDSDAAASHVPAYLEGEGYRTVPREGEARRARRPGAIARLSGLQ